MKILFVTEPFLYEYLGIMYISAVLKNAGHETKLHKTSDPISNAVDFEPDFVLYSVMTGSHKAILKYNLSLKKKTRFISIFGGPHATYFPGISKEKGVDYVLRGEGEISVLDILKKPKQKVIVGKLVKNLDDVPFPDRELIYSIPEQRNNPIKHFIASRGCPFDCPYCYNHVWRQLYREGMPVRYRSPENVIAEIVDVTDRYPTKFVYFQDDCFDLNKKWLYRFLDLYKTNFSLPFHCVIRIDLLNEMTVKKLADSGCMCVRCAAESGNDYLRNTVLRRNMTKKQIYQGAALLREYGIEFVLQNILGLPESNLERDFETLRLNMKCKPTLGWCSIFQPYPMTELGKKYDIDVDDFQPNFYDDSIIDLPHKTEVKRLQRLFAFTVRYHSMYHFLPMLIRLPLDSLYKRLWRHANQVADKELYGGII